MLVLHVLQLELSIGFVDVFENGVWASLGSFGTEDGSATFVDHVGNVLAHIEQIAGTFVAIAT